MYTHAGCNTYAGGKHTDPQVENWIILPQAADRGAEAVGAFKPDSTVVHDESHPT